MARKLKKLGQVKRQRKAPLKQKTVLSNIVQPKSLPDAQSYRLQLLKNELTFDENKYEFSDRFVPSQSENPLAAHTFNEMVYCLEKNKNVEIDAVVLGLGGKKKRIVGREAFLKSLKESELKLSKINFRENDYFASDAQPYTQGVNSDDFLPLLGGPFFKQLYIQDFLRMQAASFYAWHHDPIAKAVIDIYKDFVLGRGFSVHCDDPFAVALWDAFCEVNDFNKLIENHFVEKEVYGESMIWRLPQNELYISYQRKKDQLPAKGLLPRLRLIDPSCIWEIVTYPEDINQVLFYQWIAPTQYQTYTAPGVPSSKFIFQQIPASQVIHKKINCASNEKRGRSSLFPVLGYLKRLRDSVNYSLVGMQKASAWAIDTTVDGNQSDINAYAASQAALGTLPPAGSEFIHSKKIERKYLSNEGSAKGAQSTAFDWCLSMIAAGTGIPVSYFGTHLSGGQTRASAMIATEPTAKRFESKRIQIEQTIKEIFTWVTGEKCDVVFPELISQDSSIKMKDIKAAQLDGYISKRRAAELTAKELNINNYNFDKEQKEIETSGGGILGMLNPLTLPGLENHSDDKVLGQKATIPNGITGKDRKKVVDGKYS